MSLQRDRWDWDGSQRRELEKSVRNVEAALQVQIESNVDLARQRDETLKELAVTKRDLEAETRLRLAIKAENEKLRERLDVGPNESFK